MRFNLSFYQQVQLKSISSIEKVDEITLSKFDFKDIFNKIGIHEWLNNLPSGKNEIPKEIKDKIIETNKIDGLDTDGSIRNKYMKAILQIMRLLVLKKDVYMEVTSET